MEKMQDKKINISDVTNRKLELICFFRSISKKDFVEKLIERYLKENPLPQSLKVTKEFRIEVTK